MGRSLKKNDINEILCDSLRAFTGQFYGNLNVTSKLTTFITLTASDWQSLGYI